MWISASAQVHVLTYCILGMSVGMSIYGCVCPCLLLCVAVCWCVCTSVKSAWVTVCSCFSVYVHVIGHACVSDYKYLCVYVCVSVWQGDRVSSRCIWDTGCGLALVCDHVCLSVERDGALVTQGWPVRLITFSGWLGVNQCRLIVPAHVDVFSLKCLYLLVKRDDDSLRSVN